MSNTSNVPSMSVQESVAHITGADSAAKDAEKEMEAAKVVLQTATDKFNYSYKYARLTRDFTKKVLSASSDEKVEKIRKSYRAKFGALEATQVLAKVGQKALPATKEESRMTIKQGLQKVEETMTAIKEATTAIANTEVQKPTVEAVKQEG
jgi:hypothetical protein